MHCFGHSHPAELDIFKLRECMTCTGVNCVTSFLTSFLVQFSMLALFNMGLQAIHVYGLKEIQTDIEKRKAEIHGERLLITRCEHSGHG